MKRKESPYQKRLDKEKEDRAKARAEARVERMEAKSKAKDKRKQAKAIENYSKTREAAERDEALRIYQGWSINELRSDCKDYGISDERKHWTKMSKEQLAVWLYKHRGKAQRTYYR